MIPFLPLAKFGHHKWMAPFGYISTHIDFCLYLLTVIKVIQATVGATKNLGNTDELLQTILRQMRPVVLNAAQNALQTSPVAGNFDCVVFNKSEIKHRFKCNGRCMILPKKV